jgi:hypothetical protein
VGVVVVVAQEVLYVSPDLRMSELRKSGSACISETIRYTSIHNQTLPCLLPLCSYCFSYTTGTIREIKQIVQNRKVLLKVYCDSRLYKPVQSPPTPPPSIYALHGIIINFEIRIVCFKQKYIHCENRQLQVERGVKLFIKCGHRIVLSTVLVK